LGRDLRKIYEANNVTIL